MRGHIGSPMKDSPCISPWDEKANTFPQMRWKDIKIGWHDKMWRWPIG
jgi:hypothetical protein